jgi:hypothetical protein
LAYFFQNLEEIRVFQWTSQRFGAENAVSVFFSVSMETQIREFLEIPLFPMGGWVAGRPQINW